MSKPALEAQEERRRRAVRTAIITALVAIAFYIGFIVYMGWLHRR